MLLAAWMVSHVERLIRHAQTQPKGYSLILRAKPLLTDCQRMATYSSDSLMEVIMDTVRLRPLCYALGFNATRPEQWISRGYLQLSEAGVPGRARQLTKGDAVKLLALAELVDAGFDAAKVWYEVRYIPLYKSETFLVISTGRLGLIIPTSERGSPAPTDDECRRVHVPGRLYSTKVPREKLLETITDPNRYVSVIISLDNLKSRVNEAWSKIESKSDENGQ